MSRKNELMIKELNVLNETRQEMKLKIGELTKEIKELKSKVDIEERDKDDMRRTSNELKLELLKEQNNNKLLS